MRVEGDPVAANNGVFYFVADHPQRSEGGSTSVTICGTATTEGGCGGIPFGNKVGEMKYAPFGETRYTWGSTPTDRRFIPLQGTGRPTRGDWPGQPVRLRRENVFPRAGTVHQRRYDCAESKESAEPEPIQLYPEQPT